MKNRIVILGSGSTNLVPDKAAASVLIEKDGVRLVYDFGRGVAIRLTEFGLKQDDVEHIFISHFHPDHVTDLLPYLHAASWSQIDARTKNLNIYGPSGTKAFLEKMFAVFGPESLKLNFDVHIHDIIDRKLTIEEQLFEVFDLHHSHGLRFSPYAIAGDSSLHEDLVRLLKDAEVGIFASGHITDEEIVQLAVKTQAKILVCSHQYRILDQESLNLKARSQGFKGELIAAHDLMEFDIDTSTL